MFRALVLAFLASYPLAAGPAADLARAIHENTLDRDTCYRVRDLTLFKEDIRIYFSDGYLIFSKPIAGRPIAAVFTTDVESGDGEVILRPPSLAERRSLASYTGSPNLDVHFQAVLLFFTGDVYKMLTDQIADNPANRKAPEAGVLLEDQWTASLRSVSPNYDARLVLDLMNAGARKPDFVSAIFRSSKMGDFDILYDPESSDQIAAGQFVHRNNRAYFDVWTHFPARSFREKGPGNPIRLTLNDFRIQANIDATLDLNAVTRLKLKTNADNVQALPFDIAKEMTVSEVTVDGKPAEVMQRESGRASAARGENALFLVIPPQPLRAGADYEFEFHHSGRVILNAGEHIYYVTARGNWYPAFGPQFAMYDLTFRYPRELELVTPGDVIEDRTEGEWRITRRRPSAPIRMAGFNLGEYAHAAVTRSGYLVDVCANRKLEPALQPRPVAPLPLPVGAITGRRPGRGNPAPELSVPSPPAPLNPLARLERLANDIGAALEFMASKFGPPALPHLTVSPIPGNFGQGYPGLIYLSTRSYVRPDDSRVTKSDDLFFDELLQAHETAHQWWGGQVTSPSYRDDWLMEALANYSALLYMEKRKGAHDLETMLDTYRTALLAKRDTGEPVESAGPIVLGTRLESSLEPRAWNIITYGKGSWILHMLRQRMGDERFFSLLAEIVKRYGRGEISTENFRALAAEFLPPKSDDPKLEAFFDQWVYGTGIPSLKLSYSLKGKAPALKLVGTLTQDEVPEDFSTLIPVEIQVARGKTTTQWVRSASDPVTFSVNLQQPPLKVTLDPHYAVLRR
ncbi:MAG: hypothetical protein C5B51_26020 [Terriglobia bacterium]|nr:MAG: hypothetical protein C5B51_26020 [Terriglobia bacterium]